MAVVYFLADPRAPRRPRYVGSTKNPGARAYQHAKPSAAGNRTLTAWKRQLRDVGLAPLLVVVASHATREAARQAEWRLMARWRRRGLADLNSEHDGRWLALQLTWAAQRKWRAR